MTAHIPENSVEAQEVGRVPDGTGLSSLRDEAADASSPKASIPSRRKHKWVAWGGGKCPIPHAQPGQYEIKWQGHIRDECGNLWTDRWSSLPAVRLAGWESGSITAYRVVQP